MDWLFEGEWTVYLVLALAAAVLLALWWGDRKPHWLWLLLVPVGLALLYFVLDILVETRYENIRKKLYVMASGVKARDTARIFAHIAPAFKWGNANREEFRKRVEDFFRDRIVEEVGIWEVRIDPERPNLIILKAKPRGGKATGAEYFLVRTYWAMDTSGEWKMTDFTVHNPYSDSAAPMDIPNLPR